ncbi:ABC transporter substrate-binding protein [Roseomonas eburnea]|uniref:ABC transporter substrate-binding protein n=1 Tax=Neoroseomonas eburnea TaxID=1346889 RepID=A0A9X9XBP9_9PROT|nr:ABC transporter substrate-binding protein [Neoroseomonas eburnea]MBR0681135.1 ABC transporter substrate-binding protein [Neoroseomonas eburnea]
MRRLALALAFTTALAAPLAAQTLRIGMAAETSAADPHNYASAPNSTYRTHIFDGLTALDARQTPKPALATAWSRRDDLTWVFDLRQGVTFHNGQPFTAEDVVFSYCRVLNNESEVVGSFSREIRRIAAMAAEGPHRLVIRTATPEPLLVSDLASIAIIPRGERSGLTFTPDGCGKEGPWPGVADFNEGRAAIGTGPYRLRSYDRSGGIELARYDGYWGEKPHWAEVRLRPVTNAGPRLAGLLAGDLDIVEAPATADVPRIRQNQNFALAVSPTTRLIFLQLDQRQNAPFVQGPNGSNPLRDVRVRQALSLAIDRRAIAERIMDGLATPAGQLLPEGMSGTVRGAGMLPYDPARARALLAEAGVSGGFSFTLHATNNRYVNDSRVAQALAQYFQRVGVTVAVDAMPSNVFFPRRGRKEFSVPMGGWGPSAGETQLFMRAWITTTDRERGYGMSNYAEFSDPEIDRLARAAFVAMDEAERERLMEAASRLVIERMPVIPIQFENAAWAFRRGLAFEGRMDQTTPAFEVKPAR